MLIAVSVLVSSVTEKMFLISIGSLPVKALT